MNQFSLTGKLIEKSSAVTATGLNVTKFKVIVQKRANDEKYGFECFEIASFKDVANIVNDIPEESNVAVIGKIVANNYESDSRIFYNANLVANSVEKV